MRKNLIFCLCLMAIILIVSSEYDRVTKLWKLTIKGNATNTGTDAENVKAFVAINEPHMTVIDGELNFDNIPAGSTKVSTDT